VWLLAMLLAMGPAAAITNANRTRAAIPTSA
jgi:hypothetical protein